MEQGHQSLFNLDNWLNLGLDSFAEEPAFHDYNEDPESSKKAEIPVSAAELANPTYERRGSVRSQDELNGPDLFFSPPEFNHTGYDQSIFLASTATISSAQAAEFSALTEGEPLHTIDPNPYYSRHLILIYILQSLGGLLSLPGLYYKDNQITLPKMNFSALLSQIQACSWPFLRLHPQAPNLFIYLSSQLMATQRKKPSQPMPQ